MKIGILTQPLGCNYGGNIQNWALQQTLIRLGHQPETINICRNQKLTLRDRLWAIKDFSSSAINRYLKRDFNTYVNNPFSIRYRNHEPLKLDRDFRNKIVKTKEIALSGKWQKEAGIDSFEAFIVGSDQVWRQEFSHNIETFFLDFLSASDNRPRIAYSASFGSEDPIEESLIPNCASKLKLFKAVSVREYSAIKLLEKKFNFTKAQKTLDPTLLLKAPDYESLIRKSDRNQPCFGCYILDSNEDKNQIIGDIKSQFGIKERLLSLGYKKGHYPTMSEWLSMYADSEFVVTDSFHGCVFSIIFHKPFVVIANEYRGLDRFLSLLKDLNLTDRLVFSHEEFESRKEQLLSPIDWEAVDTSLQRERDRSLAFLRNALEK